MQIIDISNLLVRHATKKYSIRDAARAISGIVIHHTTGPVASPGTSAEGVARFHVNNRGWPGIGYHYFIDVDGKVYQTNQDHVISWHAGSPNASTLGIVLRGFFTGAHPTKEQQGSLLQLLVGLRSKYKIATVAGHGMYPRATASQCPGLSWPQWLPGIIEASLNAGQAVRCPWCGRG